MVKGFLTADNVYYESMTKLGNNDREVPLRTNPSETPPVVTATATPSPPMNSPPPNSQWPPPPHSHYPPYYYPPGYQQPHAPSPTPPPRDEKEKSIFGNVGWKDLITFIYFLTGIAGLWVNMSDRTLILEQKMNASEKELVAQRDTFKEEIGKRDSKERSMESRIQELQMLVLRATEKK